MDLDTENASETRDLYRSDTVVVRQVAAGDRDRWAVTFDNYGIGPGFDRPGFGEAYFQTRGISAIHIMGRGDDWYQYADMDAAMATVRTATQGATRILTYGSSMGAYAALRFADAAGATDVLALSPQYSIDPKVAPNETRWSQDFRRIRWQPRMLGPMSCSARAVIIYDPIGPDRWHGERITQDIACHSVRLPYTAHPVTTYLYDVGLLDSLIAGMLNGDFDVRAFRRQARAQRAASGIYLGEIAEAQPRRRAGLALALARRALDVGPGNPHARVCLARLLSLDGQHAESLTILEELVQQSERALTYVVDYGNALLLAGRTEESRSVADEVLARTDNVAHLQAWAAHICWLKGDVADARRLIRKAASLDSGNRHYLRAIIDYHFGRRQTHAVRGVAATPLLRLIRWVAKGRLLGPGATVTARRILLPQRRQSDSAPDGAG